MKLTNMCALGALPLIFCAGCSHRSSNVSGQTNLNVPVPVASATVTSAGPKTTPDVPKSGQAGTSQPASREPAVITAQERETLNQRLARLEDALFDYNKAKIRGDALEALRDDVTVIRGILANYPQQKLIIEGHTDERGSSEYNLALGDQRARAAEEFLSSMGIASEQLRVISYGEEKPACTALTETCWQRNRRAHISVAR